MDVVAGVPAASTVAVALSPASHGAASARRSPRTSVAPVTRQNVMENGSLICY